MDHNDEKLKLAANKGTDAVKKSLEKLTSFQVDSAVVEIKHVGVADIKESIKSKSEKAVVCFSKLFNQAEGVAILSMSREEAMVMVDLLNNQEPGTTGILHDVDRSAIKETLNILSNAYLNEMADIMTVDPMLGPPQMITAVRLSESLEQLVGNQNGSIMFSTNITIAKHKLDVDLFLIFSEKIAEKVKNI
jgi:chemotaxis protein CheY-P-specific phosphatase CheC